MVQLNRLRPLIQLVNTNQKLYKSATVRAVLPLNNKNYSSTAGVQKNTQQQNLPHLPLPKLDDTLDKYLRTVRPFLNDTELKQTECLLNELRKSNGPKLQQFLEGRAKNCENWLADWWLDVAYLSYRDPVVIYTSPGQSLPLQHFCNLADRLQYTANLIVAALNYKKLIDSGTMPVEKMGKDPLDMNQYNKIFGTCRIPGVEMDQLVYNPHSEHIVIACNNNFYKLQVFKECKVPDVNWLVGQLAAILQDGSCNAGVPIGILTTENRNNWGRIYQEMQKNERNVNSLCAIQKSLFLVCFDGEMPAAAAADNKSEDRMALASQQLIHGGGSRANSANRWFDKTVQFVIGTDGIVGLTYEHSPSEGQPIAVMADYLHEYIKTQQSCPESNNVETSDGLQAKKLDFIVDATIEAAIQSAIRNADKLIGNLEMASFRFDDFGKDLIKAQKLSPDSFVQMALQLAFYRLHNEPAAQYESAATRKYLHGRTETIRSCSCESIQFARTMLDPKKSPHEKGAALRTAVDVHKKYTVEALNGYGVDRHLLGLRLAAQEIGEPPLEIFQDAGFKRSMHWRVSTSQVATKCDAFMSYGPAVNDGYGCCYNPRPKDINFGVSAFVDNCETSAEQFKCALSLSLREMAASLLQKSKL